MGCKWTLSDMTNGCSLKFVGDPHEAGKLIIDSPHEAAADSWHPHEEAIELPKNLQTTNYWVTFSATLSGIVDMEDLFPMISCQQYVL